MRLTVGKRLCAALLVIGVAVGIPVAAASGHGGNGRENSHHDGEGGDHGRHGGDHGRHTIKHVLLISVDGLHQSDLAWYVQQHPDSYLAKLARSGAEYTNARTPIPSDSFPGMVGQVTGGDPSVTGVYYDDTFNHNVYPSVDASQASCTGLSKGGEVTYFEQLALNFNTGLTIDSGAGLPGLPGNPFSNDGIVQLTSNPTTLIDTNELPRDSSCNPIYPHSYVQVNTIFDVIHEHHMLTAWSDKHAAYEILNGPQGHTIDDLFTPEINAPALKPDGSPWQVGGSQVDYTGDNAATMQYDDYKVQAVLNELAGWNHQHTEQVGVPAILGMNFQTVSTAQKLPISEGLAGGYSFGPDGVTPGPLLQRALDYINSRVGMMVSEIRDEGLADSTAIILSAKHGQSPQDPRQMVRVPDAPIMTFINSAWATANPAWEASHNNEPLILGGTDDDALMWWLNDTSQAAADFVTSHLMGYTASGNALDCTATSCDTTSYHSVTAPQSGLQAVYGGEDAAEFFHVPYPDPLGRVPDIIGVVKVGVVYTGGHGKIAEHGGANPGDRDVPLVVYAPGHVRPNESGDQVETTQIAPTILRLLGLDPNDLQAVQIEGTKVLPGIGG